MITTTAQRLLINLMNKAVEVEVGLINVIFTPLCVTIEEILKKESSYFEKKSVKIVCHRKKGPLTLLP